MTPSEKIVVIDGCALPLGLYNEAREAAISTGKTQLVGVIYDAPPAPPPPTDAVELFRSILMPSRLFTDLREGNHLRYMMGCTREELGQCGCAMILYISPRAEEETP